jgi:hypothetical protein
MRPYRKIAVWTGASVLLGLVLALTLERTRGQWQLRTWISEARQRGERLTLAELLPADPVSAADTLEGVELRRTLDPYRVYQNGPMPMPSTEPGRAFPITQAESIRVDYRTLTTWTQYQARVETTLAKLPALRRSLTNGSLHVRVDRLRGLSGVELRLEALPVSASEALNAASRSLGVASLLSLRAGMPGDALPNLEAQLALADLMKPGIAISDQYARFQLLSFAAQHTWEFLQSTHLTEAQAGRLQTLWSRQQAVEGMNRALETEQALVLGSGEASHLKGGDLVQAWTSLPPSWLSGGRALRNPSWELYGLVGPLAEMGARLRAHLWVFLWKYAWADQNRLVALRSTQSILEAGRQIARGGNWQSARTNSPPLESMVFNPNPSPAPAPLGFWYRLRFWASCFRAPQAGTSLAKATEVQTICHLTTTALVLHRHRLRTGAFPTDLSDLLPEFQRMVPSDPFTGRPFEYRRTENDGFLLYSIGPDGVDHQGLGPLYGGFTGPDIVWPAAVATPGSAPERP